MDDSFLLTLARQSLEVKKKGIEGVLRMKPLPSKIAFFLSR